MHEPVLGMYVHLPRALGAETDFHIIDADYMTIITLRHSLISSVWKELQLETDERFLIISSEKMAGSDKPFPGMRLPVPELTRDTI